MAHTPGPPIHARIAWLTVSDTRTVAEDTSGDRALELIRQAGHEAVKRDLLPDEPERVADWVRLQLADPRVEAVVTSGGTGVSRRDRTVEAIDALLEQRLPGFGELFRMLSFEQVGGAAMLSRAVGGAAAGKPLFCLPGSSAAVELALSRLILPQLDHLLRELSKH